MIGFALALSCLVLACQAPYWGLRWCNALGSRYLHSGRRAACRRVIGALRVVPDRNAALVAANLRVRLAADDAQTSAAVAEAERLIASSSRLHSQALYSAQFVDIWVNAGHYHSAILAPRRFRWALTRAHKPALFEIANINRAEALHNIGRNDLALKLLARNRHIGPIARNGGLTLEAWILADIGRTDAALELFYLIDPRPLSPYYASELLFTRALIALTVGDSERAFADASEGLARVVRSSSERNGLFLLGRIEAQRGNLERAIEYYERGRSHRYRGQSARGLFELGQLYERQDLLQAAQAVYAQALAEDRESAAAARSRERLVELGAYHRPSSAHATGTRSAR